MGLQREHRPFSTGLVQTQYKCRRRFPASGSGVQGGVKPEGLWPPPPQLCVREPSIMRTEPPIMRTESPIMRTQRPFFRASFFSKKKRPKF